MPRRLSETVALSEAAVASAAKTGRALIEFITPGWGASGYYSPQVLEQAAADRVIPKGTHMYADHPTEAENLERPIRSVKDLVGIVQEDAYVGESGGLVGEVAERHPRRALRLLVPRVLPLLLVPLGHGLGGGPHRLPSGAKALQLQGRLPFQRHPGGGQLGRRAPGRPRARRQR